MEQKVSIWVWIVYRVLTHLRSPAVDFFVVSWLDVSFCSWDEWVPESRVLKYVDSNLAKQKELQKANQ